MAGSSTSSWNTCPGDLSRTIWEATGPLDIDEALAITYKCCLGLGYIHFHGVIHRDIKPGNIMYHPAQGVTKLMDFSIAHKIEEPPLRDTGTIAYMAPEHFDKEQKISLSTDIFAMGSSMYRFLTGKYPFDNRHTAFQIMHQDPEPIVNLRNDVPDAVAALTNKAMAKKSSDRFRSAAEFAMEVETVMKRLYPDSDLIAVANKFIVM